MTGRFVPARLGCRAPAVAFAALLGAAPAAPLEVRIAWLGATDTAAWLGAGQGLAEANRQGRFLGRSYVLEPVSRKALMSDAQSYAAVLVAADADTLLAAADAAPGHPVLNVTAQDDFLRTIECRDNLLHVIPSARMRADAEAQWRAAHPGSRARARAWHPAFEKYAAAQLNNRFRRSHGRDMDEEAWAGWAAVRLVAEAAAHGGNTEPRELLAFLRGELAFDGQKGVDMSFRPTGQLRQPLLLVEDDEVVGEAPLRGATGGLDSLGAPACAPATPASGAGSRA